MQAFLVSHTHWDREWYLTFSRFRVNLIEVVDRVLEALENEESFTHFVLDGQCAVLEDYLAAAPHQRDRLAAHIRAGRLAIGPWYVLPDEFLVSGEATVRNLMIGHRTAASLGPVSKVGYMPDSFGHLAQIPQLLRLAGIDSFIFTRGLGEEAAEQGWLFRWAAPDGSEVLAVNQCEGYCNAAGLGFAEIWHAHTRREVDLELAVEKIRALLEKMRQRPGSQPALLNNGCDHFPPQQDFARVLQALNQNITEAEFIPGSFPDFLAAARAHTPDQERPRWQGELLGGKDHFILSGVWSTRMYLKQENENCQNLLCRYLEPLAAAAHFVHGDSYPAGLLDTTWRQLLRNHPHDSICGCSTDSVHKDMETRFAAVRQTGEQFLSRLMDRLTPTFGRQEVDDRRTVISVANPLPIRRDEVVERLVVLQPLGYDLENLHLLDEAGREVPFRILERHFLERFWGIDYRAELFCNDQLNLLDTYLDKFGDRIIGTEKDRDEKDCFLLLQFFARDLPALGHRQYFLTDQPGAEASPEISRVSCHLEDGRAILANEFLQVCLNSDGTFDLTDRRTGQVFQGLNLLEDTEDIGDEYDYSPAVVGGTFFSGGLEGKVRILEHTDLKAKAEARFRLDLPRSLARDRQSRQERLARCDVRVRLTLTTGLDRVDVETDFNNHAFDHRLRAWFPTGIHTGTVVSDGHFMLNHRPLKRPSHENWSQPAPPTWPQQDFSYLQDDRDPQRGLAIFNRGLPEFETWCGPDGGAIFAMTLLRGVDWLSRDDFSSRGRANAGPTLHTPDAQCYGRHTFRYAVSPFNGDPLAARLPDLSHRYRTEPLTHQGVDDQLRPGDRSFLEKSNPRVALTAIKKAANDHCLVVRLCNLSAETATETLTCGPMILRACLVDLLEESDFQDGIQPAITHGGERVRVSLGPFQIVTVSLTLAPEENP